MSDVENYYADIQVWTIEAETPGGSTITSIRLDPRIRRRLGWPEPTDAEVTTMQSVIRKRTDQKPSRVDLPVARVVRR